MTKPLDMATLRSWDPCYDPNRHLPEDWTGTIIDLLKIEKIPLHDRLWVALRTDLVSERLMRLFAVWCARQVQHLMTDPRSIAALDVAQRFAMGEATEQERATAWAAARDAAGAAAGAAAWDAARDAARAAAWAAAWDAAWDAAGAAARDAAWAAAWAAARDAAGAAAWAAARAAAGAAARDAAGAAQIAKLIEMIEAEQK